MTYKMSWPRMLALVSLLLALVGGTVGSTGRVGAAAPDCGDGHKWDDAQQMCVDQEPSDCVNGQVWDDIQQMCVDSASGADGVDSTSTAVDGSDVTPSPTPTVTMATASLTVTVNGCPSTYDFSASGANPAVDCTMPIDGAQVTYRVPDRQDLQPVNQPATNGTTSFVNPVSGPFTLDLSLQPGAPAPISTAWICQDALGQQSLGSGMSIGGQFQDGEQLTCAFYVIGPQATPTATPVVRQGIVAGQELGSIRIELSLCKQGFDPAASPGVDLSEACNQDYSFVRYPITFTAFGTTHDTATAGVIDTFFNWVKWDDNLGPDTYRVEAKLPAGISTVLFEYCGDSGTVSNGTLTFMAPITAGSNFVCGLDAVMDPAVPTPTRAPNANGSSLSLGTAVCPAGFVPGPTETDPNRVCTGTATGLSFNLNGPAGSANPLTVGGKDNLTISGMPGVYHASFTMPEGIASVAGARCTVYDIIESHWVDDVVLTPTIADRDVAFDIDLPGAMVWSCTFFVVPTGPSPTPSPTTTPTATVTPTPTNTPTFASSQGGTTSQPASQGQSEPTSQPQTSGQNAIVIGPPTSVPSVAPTGAAANAAPETAIGTLAIVIHSFICPVGAQEGGEGSCLTIYPGAAFTLQGSTTGVVRQSTSGDILADAALFTELPPDTYAISPQRVPGIASTFGSCELFVRDAKGVVIAPAVPVTPAVADNTIMQAFDTATHVFVCNWYSVPDASFAALQTPVPPQGVSLTVHAFTCPMGYDPASADANPALDCLAPARNVPFALAGQTSGTSTELTTGVVGTPPPDPKLGTTHTGTLTFVGLTADTYTLTQGTVDGPVNAFTDCSLATATNAAVPIYPSVANGAITYQLNDNEALTCTWYVVPNTDAVVPPPAGTAQGGTATGNAQGAGAAQGGATDDGTQSAQPAVPASNSGQGGATDDQRPTDTPASQQGGATDGTQGTASDGQTQAVAPPDDGVSTDAPSTIYVFIFQCPPGYSWNASDPNVGIPCVEQPDGVAIAITGRASAGARTQKSGESVPGGVVFDGLAADTYEVVVTLPQGQRIEVRPCDVTGATDGSLKTPMQLTFSKEGKSAIVLPADTTYSCNWYLVPDDSASAVPATQARAGDIRRRIAGGELVSV